MRIKNLLLFIAILSFFGCRSKSSYNESSVALANAYKLESWNPGRYSAVGLTKGSSLWCSGVVVANDTILTAAHCNLGQGRLNIHFSEKVSSTPRSHIRKADQFIPHPNFKMQRHSSGVLKNDIAIVKFSGGLPTGYRPIPIYQKFYNLHQGLELVQVGHGKTSDGFLASKGSRLTNKSIVNNLVFDQVFGHYIQSGEGVDVGVCKGDSGGPAYASFDNSWYLVGVVSSSGCDRGKRVDHIFPGFYFNWIFQ